MLANVSFLRESKPLIIFAFVDCPSLWTKLIILATASVRSCSTPQTTVAIVLLHSSITQPATRAIARSISSWIRLQISACAHYLLNITPLPKPVTVACLRSSLTKLLRPALAQTRFNTTLPITPAYVWLHSCTALPTELAPVHKLILSIRMCFQVLARASPLWEFTPLISFVFADYPLLWTRLTTLVTVWVHLPTTLRTLLVLVPLHSSTTLLTSLVLV